MKESFGERIASFFNSNTQSINHKIIVTRTDGVVLYKNFEDDTRGGLGVLMSGAWQAAEALLQMAQVNNKAELRFSFDSSSSGVTILPLEVEGNTYYISCIYRSELNPAKQKNKLKNIKNQLSKFLLNDKKEASMEYIPSEKITEKDDGNPNKERKSYLFNDISDAEIDSLFSPAGF